MTKKTFQQAFNIDYPIIQAPMAGNIVSPDFVAQVSNFGFMGSIASGYLTIEQTRAYIEQVQSKTDRPFQLNIFVDYTSYGDTPLNKPAPVFKAEQSYSGDASPQFTIPPIPTTEDFIQLAVDCQVPVVSTTFALLSDAHVEKLKSNKIKIINTVNSVYELKIAVQSQKPDALIFQNNQAGGHRGGFTPIPHSDNTEIIAELKNHPHIYCMMAGGIVDKGDIDNALSQGFDGVSIGTAFIATIESSAHIHKDCIVKHNETIFTNSVTGKYARGIKNKLTTLPIEDDIGFPYLHYATASLRKKAKENNDMQYQSLWAGGGIKKIDKISKLQDYMTSLID